MSNTVIEIENVSKRYRLGVISSGALVSDLRRWWARVRGAPDPFELVTAENARSETATSDYVWALHDVNLTVEQGEVLGIVGANGAGKSTLLKLLSRVTAPTEGEIRARGRIASLLEVGTGFHPELTGRENVFLNGAILGMDRAEIRAKFDEIVEFSGCQRYIDTPVKRYSSGMYVRLAFAVAAHLEPEIMVVDEVLAVGDLEFQRKCLGKMRDVANQGRTVLFVSHNMVAIENLCSRAVQVANGRIVASGTPSEVVSRYSEQMVSGLQSGAAAKDGVLYTAPPDKRTGDYAITRIQLLSPEGDPLSSIGTWDPVRMRIHYRAAADVPRAAMEVEVRDSRGTPLLLCATEPDSGVRWSVAAGEGSIDCVFPRWPLSAGEFLLCASMTRPGVEYLTTREPLCRFTVNEANVFGSNLPPRVARCRIAADHRWDVA